jgi:hypothetical protein
MVMRRRTPKLPQEDPDLWVAPRLALRGPDGNRGFQSGGNLPPESGARFLELADIALGLKKPASKPEKRKSGGRESSKRNSD